MKPFAHDIDGQQAKRYETGVRAGTHVAGRHRPTGRTAASRGAAGLRQCVA